VVDAARDVFERDGLHFAQHRLVLGECGAREREAGAPRMRDGIVSVSSPVLYAAQPFWNLSDSALFRAGLPCHRLAPLPDEFEALRLVLVREQPRPDRDWLDAAAERLRDAGRRRRALDIVAAARRAALRSR
jgi:hypothetical protein